MDISADLKTAQAFATSWNNLPEGSTYTFGQFEDWLAPLTSDDIRGKDVLELGCGNASLLTHLTGWQPARATGVDLGNSVLSARANMTATGFKNWSIEQADLVSYRGPGADIVYCIGVLHHLKSPLEGFKSVLANVKPGGRFHCWVYAREGNGVVIRLVEPMRRVSCRLPWWFTKYLVATPAVLPFFVYAKSLSALEETGLGKRLSGLPLHRYSLWIAKRDFQFFRHVAFDQLVTPQTTYIDRATIDTWLASDERIEPGSTYVQMRNGNSWKFGGRVRAS